MIAKPISRIVADYIAANVSGYTLGTNLFVGMMPDEPPAAAVIYDTAAGGTVYAQDPNKDAIAAGVQVAVRGLGYEEVWISLGQIRDSIRSTGISGLQSYSGSGSVHTIGPAIPQGGPVPLGWDERRRYTMSQSFRLFHQKQ